MGLQDESIATRNEAIVHLESGLPGLKDGRLRHRPSISRPVLVGLLTFVKPAVLIDLWLRILDARGETVMKERPDRREFLKSGLVATATALTAGAVGGILSPVMSFASETPDLVVSHGLDPTTITRAAVDALGGIRRFVETR